MHNMDEIRIENLHLYAYHGVFDEEKQKGQNFYINSVIYTDTSVSGNSDDLTDTVSYADVCELFEQVFKAEKYDLIEKAAEVLAKTALIRFNQIKKIDVEVRKPEAPIGLEFDSVSVKISRGWHTSYVAIGSNIGNKNEYIETGISGLKNDNCIRVTKVSDIITTKPYGGVEQDDFLNGMIEIETLYSPFELLDKLHDIENSCARTREIHWGPRTLDLDIISYDDFIINTDELVIPHIDMTNRLFVLEPLKQIAPHYVHPVLRRSITEMIDRITQ